MKAGLDHNVTGSGQERSVHVFLAQTEEEGGTSRADSSFSFFFFNSSRLLTEENIRAEWKEGWQTWPKGLQTSHVGPKHGSLCSVYTVALHTARVVPYHHNDLTRVIKAIFPAGKTELNQHEFPWCFSCWRCCSDIMIFLVKLVEVVKG